MFYVHDYLPNAPANAVALTIDDGPDLPWTPQVLAVLAEYNVKATFSLVGIHVSREPGLVRHIVAAGHGVCNHTMTHPEPFATLPQKSIDNEVAGGLQAIHAATGRGRDTVPLTRWRLVARRVRGRGSLGNDPHRLGRRPP